MHFCSTEFTHYQSCNVSTLQAHQDIGLQYIKTGIGIGFAALQANTAQNL